MRLCRFKTDHTIQIGEVLADHTLVSLPAVVGGETSMRRLLERLPAQPFADRRGADRSGPGLISKRRYSVCTRRFTYKELKCRS